MSRCARHNQDKIQQLYREGRTYREIASEVGLARGTVAKELCLLRQDRKLPVLKDREVAQPFYISGATLAALKSAAEDRKMAVRDMIEKILVNVVVDDLFNAVLEE